MTELLTLGAWGWALPSQMAHDHQPGKNTSVSGVLDVVGDIVTSQSALRGMATIATVVGGAVLFAHHRRLFRTWSACFAIPVVLACVVGLRLDVLMPRFDAEIRSEDMDLLASWMRSQARRP